MDESREQVVRPIASGRARLTSILVGLDGSRYSAAAVALGKQWTRKFGGLLVAVGVIDEPTLHGPGKEFSHSYQGAYDQLVSEERRAVERHLEQFAIDCGESQISHKVLEKEGRPCDEILLESQRYDLIMLGRHTYYQAGNHDRPCETLERVLRNTSRPVVTVPETLPSEKQNSVLLGFDGSVQASRAMQQFLAIGLQDLGEVHIVSVHVDSQVEAARTADRAVEFLRFHDVDAVSHPLASTRSPAKVLLERADELSAGLIVVGAYGQPRLREYFLGSATCTILKESKSPVFLYH